VISVRLDHVRVLHVTVQIHLLASTGHTPAILHSDI
jgi:hypothetical protein